VAAPNPEVEEGGSQAVELTLDPGDGEPLELDPEGK